ncbi:MAG TPA: heme-binding domain-containing protein [Kofleriaceae bacterium]
MVRFLKRFGIGLAMLVGLFVVMQLVPYGRDHTNPPVLAEPAWDRPATRELAVRACFDCHSNETKWPWYANVAPFSWVLQRDVDAGRSVLNFSEWSRPQQLAEAAGGEVIRSEMPPRSYRLMHGDAHLTQQEKLELARGLHATLGLPWRD